MQVKEAQLAEKQFEPVECILCGPSETRLIASTGQFGWPVYVSICKNCGLVFLNPRWTRDGYDQFYETEYEKFYRFNEAEAKTTEQVKARTVWNRILQYAPQEYRSVLDIGAGLGWGLHHIASNVSGIRLAGIEPSNYCAEHLVNQIGAELIGRDVDSDWYQNIDSPFDLVIMRMVLEHLMNPIESLKKVRQAIAPGGKLYIAVPDMMEPEGPLNEYWFRSVHTYYYSKATLTSIAARAGFKPVIVRSDNSELWGIFEPADVPVPAPLPAVYQQQMKALNRYKRKRFFRQLLKTAGLDKISRFIPRSIKGLFPKNLKQKFRELVYRH